jgi:hypothetical protein
MVSWVLGFASFFYDVREGRLDGREARQGHVKREVIPAAESTHLVAVHVLVVHDERMLGVLELRKLHNCRFDQLCRALQLVRPRRFPDEAFDVV